MDAGADLLIGHHPHVLRGCERYGRGWIVYSLGNFLGDMIWSDRMRDSAIAECRLTPDGVEDLELVPVRIADDYRPMPLAGDAAVTLLATTKDTLRRPRGASSAEPVSEESAAEYLLEATEALAEERRRSRLHFLRNVRRLPPGRPGAATLDVREEPDRRVGLRVHLLLLGVPQGASCRLHGGRSPTPASA